MPDCQACQAEDQVQRRVQRSPGMGSVAEAAPAALTAVPPQTVLGQPALRGRGNGPLHIAALQQAQQTYGNRALQRFLARQAAPLPIIQRCGDTPCNCSSEEKAQHAADETAAGS